MHIEYPKYVFHATLPMRRVENEAQEAALGEGWKNTPAAFDAPAAAPEREAEPNEPPPAVHVVEIPEAMPGPWVHATEVVNVPEIPEAMPGPWPGQAPEKKKGRKS